MKCKGCQKEINQRETYEDWYYCNYCDETYDLEEKSEDEEEFPF